MTALELLNAVREHNKNFRTEHWNWVDINRADCVALACLNEMPLNVSLRCKHLADSVPVSVAKISAALHTLCDLGLVDRFEVDGAPIEVPVCYGATETHWVTPRYAYYIRLK